VALIAALAYLAASDTAFAWVLRETARFSAGHVTVAAGSGSLWRGFNLSGIRYQDAEQRIDIDKLELSWQPSALLEGELHIHSLTIGNVRLSQLKPVPPKPLAAPASLSLPLNIRLDRLTLASFSETNSPLAFGDGVASYRYQHGSHALTINRLATPWGEGSARLTLADRSPFALTGALVLGGELAGLPYHGALALSGDLLNPRVAGKVDGKGMLAEVNGSLAPFDPLFYRKVRRLDLRVGVIDPYTLNPVWPKAKLNLALYIQPDQQAGFIGGATLVNLAPGPAAGQQIPLKLFTGAFTVAADRLTLQQSHAELISGTIDLTGMVSPQTMALDARLASISPDVLWPGTPKPPLAGKLHMAGTMAQPVLTVDLTDGRMTASGRLLFDNRPGKRGLGFDKLRVGSGGNATEINGRLGFDQPLPLNLSAKLAHANLRQLGAAYPVSDLNGTLKVDGQLGKPQRLNLALVFAPSKLGGAPLSGSAQGRYADGRLSGLLAQLRLAENRLDARGDWGAPNSRLLFDIDAPQLARIGPGFAGTLRGKVDLSGSRQHLLFNGNLRAEQLLVPGGIHARLIDASGQLQADPKAPFRLKLTASDVAVPSLLLDTLKLDADGSRASHHIEAQGSFKLAGHPHRLDLAASGGLASGKLEWQGVLNRFVLAGDAGVGLAAPARLTAGSERVSLSAANFALLGGNVRLDGLDWQRGRGLVTRGAAGNLALSRLAPWVKLPLEQNLVVAADWDLALGATPRGRIDVKRVSGDVVLPGVEGRKRALGLEQAEFHAALSGGRTQLLMVVQSPLAQVSGNVGLSAPHGIPDANSGLSGSVAFKLPALAPLAALAGPEVELAGELQGNLQVTGTVQMPSWHGQIAGSRLVFVDRHSGFKLADGVLAANIDGRTLTLTRLRFAGGKGEVVAAGRVEAREDAPNGSATIEFHQFTVFDTPQRRLIVSGQSALAFDGKGLKLTGRLRADKGRIDLPKEGAPQLSGDVVVKGRPPATPSTFASLPIWAEYDLDFGDRFLLVGRGLDVALTGTVHVSAAPGRSPAAIGQVSVVEGRYRAYNQDLDIERGVITFNGPFDNPALDVRAKRRMSPVGAGVEVTGTVAAPNLRLIADEPMTDKDKLSWLVLGRAAGAGNVDDAALAAAAAGSWLAGSANQHLGLFDDLGVVNRGEKTYANGQVDPAEQVLVVGRQVSSHLYIGYEYGIKSAEQALKLAYQLSKGWSLVLHAGRDASVETRFTLRFD
jgi:translocation and assembly module TamB